MVSSFEKDAVFEHNVNDLRKPKVAPGLHDIEEYRVLAAANQRL